MKEEVKKVHNNGGVEIMKASAGSGKTFSLAREYIRLLLTPDKDGRRNERAYRHILAVTFTNKATGEMKARIIKELGRLNADPDKSPYRDYLMEECAFDNLKELQKWSGKLLSAILNDYGSFSVSTIDRFFQTTLRAFSREIGQFAEYQIELDKDSLVGEAAARVLENVSESDRTMLKWLSDSVINSMEEGDDYKIDRILDEFARGYLSESYTDSKKALGIDEDAAFSEENIKKLNRISKEIISKFAKDFREAYQDALTIVSSSDNPNIRAKKALDKSNFKERDEVGDISPFIIKDGVIDPSKFFNGKDKPEHLCDRLQTALERIVDLHGTPLKTRNTAKKLSKQAYIFVVAKQLRDRFEEILKEKNVLSIDDTNSILRDIIAGSDAPFIYEKTGLRYNHFLLDEFQDTARVQWDNFLPLLRNSIAEGCYNLIVGDVKQSIYRWRNSDWKILNEEVAAKLPQVAENPLDNNFRSSEKVVTFNNAFYKNLAAEMDERLKRGDDKIKGIYSGVIQTVKKKTQGWVEATFCDGDDIVNNVVEAVRDAMERGFEKKDIAVIVRVNRQGAEIARALLCGGIDVVTNDSLMIGTGPTVRRLVAQLYAFNDPEDKAHSFYADSFDREKLSAADSLTDMAEQLLRQKGTNGDDLYVLAFMDLLREFVEKNGNSLDAFLKYWEDEGARKSVSSPEGSDAVTIITIHKVKGLDYPFVVLPFQKMNKYMKDDAKFWEMPDTAGTPLAEVKDALYHVGLSSKSENDLFCDNYHREKQMAMIDAANLWYVAMTRAAQAMHIVAPKLSNTKMTALAKASKSPDDKTADTSSTSDSIPEALYKFIVSQTDMFQPTGPVIEGAESENFIYGEKTCKFVEEAKSDEVEPDIMELKWASGGGEITGSRLKISSDSVAFFADDEESGISASRRRRGTVLHKIMENVRVAGDLHAAALMVQSCGDIDEEQRTEAESMLARAIADVEERAWFDDKKASRIYCERGIILPERDEKSEDQKIPDRVVIFPDHVDIIDYKFGKEEKKYLAQIRNYMHLYKRMGYENVYAYLWYIGESSHVDPVEL